MATRQIQRDPSESAANAEATPDTTRYCQSLVPGSRLEIFEDSTHMTMQDDLERYVEVLRKLSRQVEGD